MKKDLKDIVNLVNLKYELKTIIDNIDASINCAPECACNVRKETAEKIPQMMESIQKRYFEG